MNKRKILFIDDDEAILSWLKLALERAGEYEVATESQSKSAMQTVRRFKPEMIFIDISMPEKDGSTIAYEIRENQAFSEVPIVFLTGAVSADEVERSGGAIGGQTFLAKPIDMKKLIAYIDQYLG